MIDQSSDCRRATEIIILVRFMCLFVCLYICSPIFLGIAASSASKSNANLILLSNQYFSYSRGKERIESTCIFVSIGRTAGDSVSTRFTVITKVFIT